MKSKISIQIVLLAMLLLATYISKAAFPIKKEVTQPASTITVPSPESGTIASTTLTVDDKLTNIKDKIKTAPEERYIMPLALYIVLAVFWLGWLAMGLNDNFIGWRWVVSLLLYILFYLPGLIFTLVEIPVYY